ncbi:preprotein translocase subunit SecE [candidate division WOR-1 bacterium RIFCSPLOWO2_02_FULL_46_20]|uniref:Protein translocase subunit SecE n=2 Tax=Saganbacteria TaxID=1703751 RepID=A0A1F4R4Y0_UNCSA|nr:MAG: preprotein translocase subunit SecE [candidate division WOR-1 bacterium RIFCSPHIGHO2_02_FULL_45_12]OGC03291.1 MAG: preprotein translocase subunit SecE [candidate division WOR-1 bacterium RIFCSPLOWO2_02_FULL_46_20]OGC08932.1 MAG: preprotein translocase subunit SecE [candidate division WOR-1 bacterium RIFCSPLOWO2_12_FULL_45_9]
MIKDKFGQIAKFVKETRAETKKVVWPDRRHVTVATILVLVLVIITGFYVMLVDFGLAKIFGALIK